jgi:hypothetical protein
MRGEKMAVHNNNIVDIDLNSGTVFRSFLNRTLGEGDGEYNRFGIRAYRDGQEVLLTGCQVKGQFINPVGNTIEIDGGYASGNTASIVLPATCYANEGQFRLAIKLFGLDFSGTVRIIDGTIVKTTNGNIIDPGSVIPSLSNYQDAVTAAQAAVATIGNYHVNAVQVEDDNYEIVVTTVEQS